MSARLAAFAALLLLGACAAPDRVILLPDDQGHVGKLNVSGSGGETLLDSAYAEARVKSGQPRRGSTDAASVDREFGTVLAALPPAPVSHQLYFITETDQLTAESRAEAPAILAEVAKRPAAEVVVIGHTDTMGTDDYNDKLSLQRAVAVKQQLVALGFDPARVTVEGHGKRELLVQTGDGVPEARNRRAEILVR